MCCASSYKMPMETASKCICMRCDGKIHRMLECNKRLYFIIIIITYLLSSIHCYHFYEELFDERPYVCVCVRVHARTANGIDMKRVKWPPTTSYNYTSSSTTYSVFDIVIVVHRNNYIRISHCEFFGCSASVLCDEWQLATWHQPNGSSSSRTTRKVFVYSPCINYSFSFALQRMCSSRCPSVFYRIQ